MRDDGVVMVLDFTGRDENIVVERRQRRIVPCRDCGRIRVDLGGPHGPQLAGDDGVVRDCVGRLWKNGAPL